MSHHAGTLSFRDFSRRGVTVEALRQAIFVSQHNANLVFLRGRPRSVRFPSLCPNCGNTAVSLVRIERTFLFRVVHSDDSPNESLPNIDVFDVPFCQSCRDARATQLSLPSPLVHLKRIFSSGEGLGGAFVVSIGFAFMLSALREMSWGPLVIGMLPLAIGGWLVGSTWRKNRHLSVPGPTPVDLCIDFTPSLALQHEPEWRAFLFQSQPYAEAFARANPDLQWNPAGQEAARAAARRRRGSRRMTIIVGIIIVAVLLWSLWEEFLSGYFTP